MTSWQKVTGGFLWWFLNCGTTKAMVLLHFSLCSFGFTNDSRKQGYRRVGVFSFCSLDQGKGFSFCHFFNFEKTFRINRLQNVGYSAQAILSMR